MTLPPTLPSGPHESFPPTAQPSENLASSSPAAPDEPGGPMDRTPMRNGPPVADVLDERFHQRANRDVLMALGALPLAMLLGAVLVQVLGHEEPCPLCVLQRYACLLTTLGLWSAAMCRPARRNLTLLGTFAALLGAGLAAYHTMVVWNPIVSCGIDTLQPVVNGWPLARTAPLLFESMGMCTNPSPLFGVPLPLWSLFGFLITGGGAAGWWWSTRGRSSLFAVGNAPTKLGDGR